MGFCYQIHATFIRCKLNGIGWKITYTLEAESSPVCPSMYIHFLVKNSLYDSRRVRKNRCHILGHGRLAGNSLEMPQTEEKSNKIHISRPDGRGNLVDPLKITTRLDLVEVCKQIITMQQPDVPQKCIFLMLGTLYGKILTFVIFKKPFNVWNWLAP